MTLTLVCGKTAVGRNYNLPRDTEMVKEYVKNVDNNCMGVLSKSTRFDKSFLFIVIDLQIWEKHIA